ncbi:butyrophilin-like protein 2 [Archocentrus centrarchus]|uniref:butyrophilin-like protein 2 n=1 Tax=Archocentrus centrarchus TaxID=63155 RepID=UPI0011EA3C0E|nr:butyrophilin-like protein 2 [Archocentrus centrarchus]
MEDISKVCVLFCPFFQARGSHRSFFCVFLLAVVLSSCTGKMSVDTAQKIVASVGETVLLPCNTTIKGDVPTVEWTKEGLFPSIVFLYRDGCETFEMKNRVFQYRTNLIRHELHHGNLSLVISNVQPNDGGKYQCVIRRNKKKQVILRLELFVGAVSEPRLSVVPGVGGGLTLRCEARCWFPEPLITLFDNQGNELSAEDPRRNEDSSGCFTVTRRVILQTAINRVTCRVHQPEIKQTRHSEIYIPGECLGSSTKTIIITVSVMIVLVAVIACLVKKCECSVGRQKSSLEKKQIVRLTTEPNDLYSVLIQVQQSSQSTNDSRSSQGTTKPVILPPPESPHTISIPKPEASANRNHPNSNSLAQIKDSSPAVSGLNPAPGCQLALSTQQIMVSSDNGAVLSSPPADSKEIHLARSKSLLMSRSRTGGAHALQRSKTVTYRSKMPYKFLKNET